MFIATAPFKILLIKDYYMKKFVLLIVVVIIFSSANHLLAQHDHHPPAQQKEKPTAEKKKEESSTKTTQPKKDTVPAGHQMHDHQATESMAPMSHAYSRNLPMSRNASGTAWLPDASPMYMYMTGKKASWMFHGNIFLRYTNTDIFNNGSRGGSDIDAPNWFMSMVNKPVGKRGLFTAKAMISLDALTEGKNGYPLLFQSGETYKGARLVDRQHPHDLFSELSIGYTHAFNRETDAFVYVGYPGEPALGAPAFMHRISSLNNPDAPLGHHWQDATHITFGVVTAGFRYKQFKIEGSSFTGREPGENRYNFDEPTFDSYSYRLSYNPTRNWAVQFSQGFITEPEALEPGTDVTRTTASVLYSGKRNSGKQLDAALIWGYNDKGDDHKEHSVLLESNYRFGRNAFYNRYEFIQKSTEELDLEDELGHATYDVHTLSLGYNRSFWNNKVVELTTGAQATFNVPARELRSLYGDMPVSFQVYVQLRPTLHKH
jgi:hypothetical protein